MMGDENEVSGFDVEKGYYFKASALITRSEKFAKHEVIVTVVSPLDQKGEALETVKNSVQELLDKCQDEYPM